MSEANMQKREALIAKIKALRAKTVANGATEAEALMASAKAAELMEKYDIEVAETAEVDPDTIIAAEYDFPPEFHNHIMVVSTAIAELCEVKVIGLTNRARVMQGYRIYGLPVDVEIAEYLHEIVIDAMQNELKKASAAWGLFVRRRQEIARHSFMDGLTGRLAERIRELAWARQHKKTGNALVVAKEAMIKKALKDLKTLRVRKRNRDLDRSALEQGVSVADRIRLDPAIKSNGGTGKLTS